MAEWLEDIERIAPNNSCGFGNDVSVDVDKNFSGFEIAAQTRESRAKRITLMRGQVDYMPELFGAALLSNTMPVCEPPTLIS